jgi:hypothetical protein
MNLRVERDRVLATKTLDHAGSFGLRSGVGVQNLGSLPVPGTYEK